MADQKPKRDISYLVGWLSAFPFYGLIFALDFFFRGAYRKAFQALLCGLMVLGVLLLFMSLKKNEPSWAGCFIIGAWIILPPVTLSYLRTIEWPAPAQRERGHWVSVIIVLVVVGILAMIAARIYEMRGILSKLWVASDEVKQRVEQYVRANQKLPATNVDVTGDKPIDSKYIESLSVGTDGAITIRLSKIFGSVAGKTIILKPQLNSGAVTWSCDGGTLPEKYWSYKCRHVIAR